MASRGTRTVSMIQDQNLNVQFNGKADVSKAPRKASTGGRKPLGDLSNSVKPTPNQASKKENTEIISLTHGSIKKKGVSTAPKKAQTSGRKALSDISNSKKNQSANLSIHIEDRCQLEDIAEEGFLHNHEECIKAQKRAISTNEFLRILGLDDFCKHSTSAKECLMSNKTEPLSPSRYAETKEMTAMLIEELSPPKHKSSRKFESCPASPEPLDHYMQWEDPKYVPSFKLIESP